MKIKDIPELKERVMTMLPATQTDIWKTLGIGHRDGGMLISIMTQENLIKRTKIKKTFLLEIVNGNGHFKKTDYSVLLSGAKFSPCSGCEKDCLPAYCIQLTEWVANK